MLTILFKNTKMYKPLMYSIRKEKNEILNFVNKEYPDYFRGFKFSLGYLIKNCETITLHTYSWKNYFGPWRECKGNIFNGTTNSKDLKCFKFLHYYYRYKYKIKSNYNIDYLSILEKKYKNSSSQLELEL
jgi:hypothetical protein